MLKAANTYYIKLGTGGEWEKDSIDHGKARIGWRRVPLAQITAGEWAAVESAARADSKTVGAGTMDFHALERFCRSSADDVWITFYNARLWWGRLKDGPVKEDAISKYRDLVDGWHDHPENKNHQLLANQIPGRIAQLQAFRGTICRVASKDALLRLLSGEQSPEYVAVIEAKSTLVSMVEKAIRGLHWKDFEVLVDLIFHQSGLRRTSAVGETMKSVDIELEDRITDDRYQVQVKSKATKAEADKCKEDFPSPPFRRFYLVVHTPAPDLVGSTEDRKARFQVILPERLATMVVDTGLTNWLLQKIA
jgi:hypothetical protein